MAVWPKWPSKPSLRPAKQKLVVPWQKNTDVLIKVLNLFPVLSDFYSEYDGKMMGNDGTWGFKRLTKPPIWDMFTATFSEVISTFHPFQSFIGRHRCQFRCLCDAMRQRDSLTCDASPGTSFNFALQPSRDVAWCVKSSPRRPYIFHRMRIFRTSISTVTQEVSSEVASFQISTGWFL